MRKRIAASASGMAGTGRGMVEAGADGWRRVAKGRHPEPNASADCRQGSTEQSVGSLTTARRPLATPFVVGSGVGDPSPTPAVSSPVKNAIPSPAGLAVVVGEVDPVGDEIDWLAVTLPADMSRAGGKVLAGNSRRTSDRAHAHAERPKVMIERLTPMASQTAESSKQRPIVTTLAAMA